MGAAGKERISAWVWAALAALVLLALAVIFVLPAVVRDYELPLVPRIETTALAPSSQVSSSSPASPFEDAQIARQRREAQDVLASLLDRQSELDRLNVSAWARADYDAALSVALAGDEAYREGRFVDAVAAYKESDLALAALQQQHPLQVERMIEQGEQALAASDADTALARFTLAATMSPGSAQAQNGLRRAQVLEQVEALLADGEQQQQQGRLSEAQVLFEQAAALDPQHPRLVTLRADNLQRQLDQRFTQAMSRGFALLQQNQADEAITAFEQALQIRPNDAQALEAIAQTRSQALLSSIASQREHALLLEQSEQWQQAIAAYDDALALDANLVFAQQGRDYSQRRLQLDALLEANLNDPLRLADPAVLQEAQQVLRIADDLLRDPETVAEHNRRLSSQFERMQQLLQQAQLPVQLTLVSDNATEVTIYQVARLGKFAQTSVELKPGRYVAVGTRPGYRDVREEFVIGFGHELESLTIRCHEQLAVADRR